MAKTALNAVAPPNISYIVVSFDTSSGITNDANDYAIETMHNPKYPLELLLRVITVSMESMNIIKATTHRSVGKHHPMEYTVQ